MGRINKFSWLVFAGCFVMTFLYSYNVTYFAPKMENIELLKKEIGYVKNRLSAVDNELRQKLKDLKTEFYELHANQTSRLTRMVQTIEKLKARIKLNTYKKDVKRPNVELINQKDIKAQDAQIMVLVTSHIGHKNRRDSIRMNWGDSSKFSKRLQQNYGNKTTYKVYFMTGYLQSEMENARNESAVHKDMLIMNRAEHYFDLSRRVMFGFLWSFENCQYDYLLKADDDVFIHIPNLFKLIHQDPFVLKHKDRLYAGNMFMNLGPHRNEKSKWHVPKEEWEPNKYPPFAPGMGVVLSRHVVGKIIPHFDWLKPFRLDDVYIGMLVYKANVTGMGIRKQVGAEFYDNINNRKFCAFPSTRIIAFHKVLENKCMTHLTNRSRQ